MRLVPMAAGLAMNAAIATAAPLEPAYAGPCPGAPLACLGSGGAAIAVAIGVPAHSVGFLVGGTRVENGPVFGSGRLCVAEPLARLGSTRADGDGTAIVRIAGRPAELEDGWAQLLWRDVYTGQTGASAITRLCPGG